MEEGEEFVEDFVFISMAFDEFFEQGFLEAHHHQLVHWKLQKMEVIEPVQRNRSIKPVRIKRIFKLVE